MPEQKTRKSGSTANWSALTVVLLVALLSCAPRANAQGVASLKSEISAIRADIKAAQAEDAKYSGGLIKALIETRIAVLTQSEAMLQQRLEASTHNITLKYMVNGVPYVPPQDIGFALADLSQELTDIATKIKNQEIEAQRYSGGLVEAMSLSTLATMRQTQAMLQQRRLALRWGFPQYVGPPAPNENMSSLRSAAPRAPKSAQVPDKDWRVSSIDTRVTESNNVWSRYAWKLTLYNESDLPHVFSGKIEFQDTDGFIVDTDNANNMLVPARSEEVFTGYVLIRATVADKVARTVAKIGKNR